jgi:hypothetical protein
MHLCFAAFDHIAGLQTWQVLKPQASCLGFTMPELPRLDDLMGGGNGAADDADRVLDAPPIYWCRHQQAHKVEGFRLFTLLAIKMPAARYRQMRAWRVGNHQVPAIAKHLFDWLLQVPLRVALAWQQIAAKSKMPATPKGITDTGAVFAGN